MKLPTKAEKFLKVGNCLNVYVKRKKFKSYIEQVEKIDKEFGDNNEAYLGCALDITQKYIIIRFALRNKDEIYKFNKEERQYGQR